MVDIASGDSVETSNGVDNENGSESHSHRRAGRRGARARPDEHGSQERRHENEPGTAAWNKVDASKSGSVTQSQAQGVVTNFKAADTNNDGKLSQAEFMAACDKGLVTASAATGGGTRGMTGSEPTSPKK